MQLKKILLSGILLSFLLIEMNAQEQVVTQKGLNDYQILINELEDKGVNIRDLLKNEDLKFKMKEFELNIDSLKYYYLLKYFPNGSDTIAIDQGFIALTGKAYGDSIVLRWGPSKVDLWSRTINSGYTLLRVNMMADDQGRMILIDTMPNSIQYLRDSLNPILPWSLEQISERITPQDTMAMIAAQAMYGSSFSSDINTDNLDFVGRHKEKRMRFGFSLLMSDRSPLAADLMGLRYVDKTAKKGKKYMYVIHPLGLSTNKGVATYILNDPVQNQKVTGLVVASADKEIKLYWPKNNNSFSGYRIERSADDGKDWQMLTAKPLVFVEQANGGGKSVTTGDVQTEDDVQNLNSNDYYVFSDTVMNNVKYIYRVTGQTPFGDYTDYAYVTGSSKDISPPPMPRIVNNSVDEESNIASLEWSMEYEPNLLKDLKGFTVWDAQHPDSSFAQVSQLLPPTARNYKSLQALEKNRSHYYVVKAIDDKGNESSSFPMYMHVIDDLPPSPPLDPAYLINDSTGVVTLLWQASEETDLAGYRVYFSNSLKSEFTQLSNAPISKNIYFDTLQLVTLSEEIYYKFQAVDMSHNRSEFSEVLTVKRPDYVAPVTPVMEQSNVSGIRIKLNWRPSTSIDVEQQILYRRLYNADKKWEVLQEFEDPSINSFEDTTALVEQLYEYSLRALDDVGLYSQYAFPVKARRWFEGELLTVKNMQVAYDSIAQAVQLNWQFEPPTQDLFKDVEYRFYVYRSLDNSPILRYRILNSQDTSFSDLKVKADGAYNYAIKVVYKNGKSSPLTEPIKVLVKRQKDKR